MTKSKTNLIISYKSEPSAVSGLHLKHGGLRWRPAYEYVLWYLFLAISCLFRFICCFIWTCANVWNSLALYCHSMRVCMLATQREGSSESQMLGPSQAADGCDLVNPEQTPAVFSSRHIAQAAQPGDAKNTRHDRTTQASCYDSWWWR